MLQPESITQTAPYSEPIYRLLEREWKDFIEEFTTLLTQVDTQIPPLPPRDVIHRLYRDVCAILSDMLHESIAVILSLLDRSASATTKPRTKRTSALAFLALEERASLPIVSHFYSCRRHCPLIDGDGMFADHMFVVSSHFGSCDRTDVNSSDRVCSTVFASLRCRSLRYFGRMYSSSTRGPKPHCRWCLVSR